MSFTSNKNIGNTALGQAIAYFTSKDYCVSLPLNDTQDYDLVVDINGKLNKVLVKGTQQRSRYNIPVVQLQSIGGRTGKVYKTLINTNVDYLFVVTKDFIRYFIPLNVIHNKYTINLNKDYEKYIVNF